jgi:Flp pilus assembly secretin CpaC
MAKIRLFILVLAVFGSSTLSANERVAPVEGAPAAAPSDSLAVTLLVGRSVVLDVATPITRVSLTSADVADALVTSPSQLLVHGKLPGSISMFVWNHEGTIQRYEITVQRDLERLRTDVKHLFPGEPIEVQGNGKFVVISGKVSSKDAGEGGQPGRGFVDKKEEVLTFMSIRTFGPIRCFSASVLRGRVRP